MPHLWGSHIFSNFNTFLWKFCLGDPRWWCRKRIALNVPSVYILDRPATLTFSWWRGWWCEIVIFRLNLLICNILPRDDCIDVVVLMRMVNILTQVYHLLFLAQSISIPPPIPIIRTMKAFDLMENIFTRLCWKCAFSRNLLATSQLINLSWNLFGIFFTIAYKFYCGSLYTMHSLQSKCTFEIFWVWTYDLWSSRLFTLCYA